MYRIIMAEKRVSGPRQSPQGPARETRTERLAAALRANLKRRKAQARSRAVSAGSPARRGEDDAAPERPME
jgi:hypothetical protein